MRRLLWMLAAVPVLFGANTTVTQMVMGPSGQPSGGTAVIRLSAACVSGGSYVGLQSITVRFTASVPTGQMNNFNVALVPNDACVISGTSPAAWVYTTAYIAGVSVTYAAQTWLALAPSTGITPGADATKWALVSTSYSVTWTLTGGQSWNETWVVPTAQQPVNVSTVRVAVANLPTVVAGLVLATGTGGMTFTIAPQDGQYIRWNALQSSWQPVTFVDQEMLSGTIDGNNAVFSLANAPNPGAGLVLFRNGMAQLAGQDYTLMGNTVTFVTAATPQVGDTLLAWYRY